MFVSVYMYICMCLCMNEYVYMWCVVMYFGLDDLKHVEIVKTMLRKLESDRIWLKGLNMSI